MLVMKCWSLAAKVQGLAYCLQAYGIRELDSACRLLDGISDSKTFRCAAIIGMRMQQGRA